MDLAVLVPMLILLALLLALAAGIAFKLPIFVLDYVENERQMRRRIFFVLVLLTLASWLAAIFVVAS